MKKFFKILGYGILIVVILSFISSCGSDSSNKNTSSSTNVSSDTKNADQSSDKNNDKKSEWIVDVEGVGKVKGAVSSDVGIAVIGVSEADTLGNEYVNQKAQGKFVVVDLAITNNQKDAINFSGDSFKLVDDKGREFSYSLDGTSAIHVARDDTKFDSKINPGMTVKEVVSFDVPKDVSNFKLKARGGIIGEDVTLPLQVQKVQ